MSKPNSPKASSSTATTTDKVYGITNIKSHIPIILDLDRLNYDSWKEIVKTHCKGYKVFDHLDGSTMVSDDPEWDTIDSIVKQWLYGTMTQSVLQAVLKTDATAAEIWKAVQELFHENKEAKAMELDDELRNLSLGNSTIMEYCTKIKSIADLLTNIGSPVPERNLVIYALNGLSSKFSSVITTLRHAKPFPTFLEMRSALSLEERAINKEQTRANQISQQDNSSSPTVLNTEHQNRNNSNQQTFSGNQNNFSGTQGRTGQFSGARGGGRNNRGRGRGGRFSGRGGGRQYGSHGGNNNFSSPLELQLLWQLAQNNSHLRGLLPSPPQTATQWPNSNGPRGSSTSSWPTQAPAHHQALYSAFGQPIQQPGTFPFSPDQPTTLPQAFSTLNLQDPGNADWYMDTGATAHLHADPGLPHSSNASQM